MAAPLFLDCYNPTPNASAHCLQVAQLPPHGVERIVVKRA
jgi:hypothetical protein